MMTELEQNASILQKERINMGREILFRGKLYNGEWVQGYYAKSGGTFIIKDNGLTYGGFEVLPRTVCQYTGLTDKNGRKIFEGDICKYYNSEDKDGIAVIREDYAEWKSGTIRQKEIMTPLFYLKCSEEWEVIGNIFDNPELLEGGTE